MNLDVGACAVDGLTNALGCEQEDRVTRMAVCTCMYVYMAACMHLCMHVFVGVDFGRQPGNVLPNN